MKGQELYDPAYMKCPDQENPQIESRLLVASERGWPDWGVDCEQIAIFFLGWWKMFWNQTVVMVVPFYKHANDYSALKMSKFYGT